MVAIPSHQCLLAVGSAGSAHILNDGLEFLICQLVEGGVVLNYGLQAFPSLLTLLLSLFVS